MKISVIDIGTNSIHTLFAEINSSGAFRVVGKEKTMVRLGDGAMMTGELSDVTANSALEIIKRNVSLSRNRGVSEIFAVATSAIRESKNGGLFLDRVREETGLKIKVITGQEEGRLIYLAVKNTIKFDQRKALVVDIGGGSTEFIYGDHIHYSWIESLRLGANRLSQLFPLSDPPKKSEIKELENYIEDKLQPVFEKLSDQSVDCLIGTSGTISSLVRMILSGDSKGGDPQNLRQIDVSLQQIKAQYEELIAKTLAERQKMKGLDKKRADMIIQGSAILIQLMKIAKISHLTICDKALREGILYDFIEKNRDKLKIEETIPDVRRRSVMMLLDMCDADKQHGRQTAKLALKIFKGMKAFYQFSEQDEELLEYAAFLHDIGYHISFHKHHKHSYYLIMNADLYGFQPDEITILSWMSRWHRRQFPNLKNKDFLLLSENLQQRILNLTAVLKIADALDHSHFSLVQDLKVKVEQKRIVLKVQACDDAQCEIYEAEQRKRLFEDVYQCQLEFKIKEKK